MDLRFICIERDISLKIMCEKIGVNRRTITAMHGGVGTPDGASLAALCKWSGLDVADYSIDLEEL